MLLRQAARCDRQT